MYSNDRRQMRDVYFDAWQKSQSGELVSAMEQMIIEVAVMHPEYQPILAAPDKNRDRDVFPEAGDTNPFMHMGLHLALREQLSMDRPIGVRRAYGAIVASTGDEHAAQHVAMDCLAEWLAAGAPHDEQRYLNLLRHAGSN